MISNWVNDVIHKTVSFSKSDFGHFIEDFYKYPEKAPSTFVLYLKPSTYFFTQYWNERFNI